MRKNELGFVTTADGITFLATKAQYQELLKLRPSRQYCSRIDVLDGLLDRLSYLVSRKELYVVKAIGPYGLTLCCVGDKAEEKFCTF